MHRHLTSAPHPLVGPLTPTPRAVPKQSHGSQPMNRDYPSAAVYCGSGGEDEGSVETAGADVPVVMCVRATPGVVVHCVVAHQHWVLGRGEQKKPPRLEAVGSCLLRYHLHLHQQRRH